MNINSKLLIYVATFSVLVTSFQKELFCPKANLTKTVTEDMKIKGRIKNKIQNARIKYRENIAKIRTNSPFNSGIIVPKLIEEWKLKKIDEFRKAYKQYFHKLSNIIIKNSWNPYIESQETLTEFLKYVGFSDFEINELTEQLNTDDTPFQSSYSVFGSTNSIANESSENIAPEVAAHIIDFQLR